MEGRDEKGRFKAGNKCGKQFRSDDGSATEAQKASSEAQVRNGIIAKAVARCLLGKDPNTGERRLDELVKRIVERTLDHGGTSDLRILADVMGELEQKVEVTGDMNFTFKFGE